MTVKNIFPNFPVPQGRTVALAVVLTFTGGCTSNGVKDSLQSGFSTVGDKVSGGIKTLKDKRSQRSGNNIGTSDSDIALVKKFPLDQVPHTLMRKPVAAGTLTSGHGYRLSPTGIPLPRKHKGVDYGADTGTAIYAAGSGTIEKLYVSSSFGKTITIKLKTASPLSMLTWIHLQRDSKRVWKYPELKSLEPSVAQVDPVAHTCILNCAMAESLLTHCLNIIQTMKPLKSLPLRVTASTTLRGRTSATSTAQTFI